MSLRRTGHGDEVAQFVGDVRWIVHGGGDLGADEFAEAPGIASPGEVSGSITRGPHRAAVAFPGEHGFRLHALVSGAEDERPPPGMEAGVGYFAGDSCEAGCGSADSFSRR